jgi:hypothetical protein
MNKSYQKYLLISLSTISISLSGMESNQQNSQLRQSDSSTWIIQPIGGYLQHNQGRKTIHFAPVNNNTDIHHPIYKFLKYGARPAVSLDIFTKEGHSYTINYNDNDNKNHSFTIISDKLYREEDFVSYHENCRRKYSEYDQK